MQGTLKLQKRALRYINKANYNSHTEPLFKRSGILRIDDLYEYHVLLFMLDYERHMLPKSFRNMFNHNYDINMTYRTRIRNHFYVPKAKSKIVANLPLLKFPSIWNAWLPSLDTKLNKACFKRFIKQKMLARYSQSTKCENPNCIDCKRLH